MTDGAKEPKVSKFKPAPNIQGGGLWSKFLTAFCPQIPRNIKRQVIGRNKPCPCGKVNEKSLEWRLVNGEMKQLPRPMKFKNCCCNAARAARQYKPRAGNPIISQRMQATLDARKLVESK